MVPYCREQQIGRTSPSQLCCVIQDAVINLIDKYNIWVIFPNSGEWDRIPVIFSDVHVHK